MIIDDAVFDTIIGPLIKIGLDTATNTKLFYEAVNDTQVSEFIKSRKLGTPQFNFLLDVLSNQEISKCPICGHYNDNIECPIIRCEICDHEWKVDTDNSDTVCNDCIALKTKHCEKLPKKGD